MFTFNYLLSPHFRDVMVQQMEEFKDQESSVTKHIPCKFATEMSHESKVVCINV